MADKRNFFCPAPGMPNEMPGAGYTQTNMAVPVTGLNQAANFGGSTMAPNTVAPFLPGQVFDARGTGAQSLILDPKQGPRVSGRQGSLDLLLTMGAAGVARTVCYLTDSLTSPTNYLAVKIDTSNRPLVKITNSLGTVVALVAPTFTALVAGQTAMVRIAWDSQNVVDVLAARYVSLRVNREIVAATWSTNPVASWAFFQPVYMVLGASLGDADFNGTILAVQASNIVTP